MTRRVYGTGPVPCNILFMSSRPGPKETYYGYPFAGKTGKELERYLWNLRLDRQSVFLDNLSKERGQTRNESIVTQDEIRRDEPDNISMLSSVRPQLIVAMGHNALRYFLGPEATLEKDHAIPRTISWTPHYVPARPRTYTIFPTYDIAAGLHNAEMQPLIDYDFQCLDAYLRGTLPEPEIDHWAGKEDYVLAAPDHIDLLESYLADSRSRAISIDTEGWPGDEWGLSYSIFSGTSVVVTREHHPQSFFDRINTAILGHTVILHNSLHDLGILRSLGINVDSFVDTMVWAYLLRVEPQGLKPLSYRHSGMVMDSYEEVVEPYETKLYLDYLARVSDITWPPGEGRRQGINKRVEGILKSYAKFKSGVSKQKVNFTDRFLKLDESMRDSIETECGLWPSPGLKHVPMEKAVPYSARDADATFRLKPKLESRIISLDLMRTSELDHAVIPMIDRMQSHGMHVDVPHMMRFGHELTTEMDSLRSRAQEMTGDPDYNLGSGDQVAAFLFNVLQLDPPRLTASRTRGSVDDKSLEELKLNYYDHTLATEFITMRTDFMERQKLFGTYVRKLPRFLKSDGRLHPNYRITRVVSGRFSSHDPNVLSIPVRTELGRRVRSGFTAPPGKLLGAWDLDQIEMRVLAHESQDSRMIAVLSDPARHIHKETTNAIFGIPVDQVDKESWQYMSSKNISFGIVYGITASGLLAQMAQRGQQRTLEECQALIDDYLTKAYPGVADYMERCRSFAARFGFIRSFCGRLRYLPGIHSPLRDVRSEAERAAGNHPIQAGATDIMKMWMKAAWDRIKDGLAEPLVPMHDELVLEFDEDKADAVDAAVRESLAEAVAPLNYSVPIKCGGKTARDWGSLK
jgi:uracil-DNA glycosylase family 4